MLNNAKSQCDQLLNPTPSTFSFNVFKFTPPLPSSLFGQRSRSTCCPARPSSCGTRSLTTRRRRTTCSRTRPTRRTSAATRPRSPASRPSSPSRLSPSRSRCSARTCQPAFSAPSSRRCCATTPSRATCRWPCRCSSCWGIASAERSTTSRRSDCGDSLAILSCMEKY